MLCYLFVYSPPPLLLQWSNSQDACSLILNIVYILAGAAISMYIMVDGCAQAKENLSPAMDKPIVQYSIAIYSRLSVSKCVK